MRSSKALPRAPSDGSRASSMHCRLELMAFFDATAAGRDREAFELYRWFLPLAPSSMRARSAFRPSKI
jgi:hypothetical protein